MNTQETTNKVKKHLQDNKKAWIWALSVLIGIVLIVAISALSGGESKEAKEVKKDTQTEEVVEPENKEEETTTETPTETAPVEQTSTQPVNEISTPKETPAIALGTNYSKAKTENTGKAIVFGEACSPSVTELKVAKNTLVFLGNESKTITNFSLNGKTSELRSSHYDLFFVGGAGSYKVLCGEKESATVVVE
jgi:hypothetical protein